MKKKNLILGDEIRQCGNVDNLYWYEYRPDNKLYDTVERVLDNYDYPVLPVAYEGEIAADRAFTVDLEDIILDSGDSAKDAIDTMVDLGDEWYGANSCMPKSEKDRVKYYYISTALCYGFDTKTGKHILLTNSKSVLANVPIIGTRDTTKNTVLLNNSVYTISRLNQNRRGYYRIIEQIDLSKYYICPLHFIREYTRKIKRLVEDNILIINYRDGNKEKKIQCTTNQFILAPKISDYLDVSAENEGEIRVFDLGSKKLLSIPIVNIISYNIFQTIPNIF